MTPSDYAANGFILAMQLLESLGVRHDHAAVNQRLAQIASGEVSVFNSPEEELAASERQWGRPATPEERAGFFRLFAPRADMDFSNSLTARQVLEAFARTDLAR